MTRPVAVDERVGQWYAAYRAVRDELTPDFLRDLTRQASTTDVASVQLGIQAARIVFANDRAAATVAAMLTATGIKPVQIDEPENQ